MLEPGTHASDFELVDGEGRLWTLRELKGQKVILFFYPADDTPGCTIEACDFRDSNRDLTAAGYVVLGISPQDGASHRDFAAKFDLNFPLLVDEGARVAKEYGAFEERGDWNGIPLVIKRSTFVIDEDGNVAHALYSISAKGHVDDLKETLGIA